MTPTEMDQFCAEQLDLLCMCEKDSSGWSVHGYGTAEGRCHKCQKHHGGYDFLTSEAANAMLLEAMPVYVTMKHFQGGWQVWWPDPTKAETNFVVNDADRKTAIVLAFIKWKESV